MKNMYISVLMLLLLAYWPAAAQNFPCTGLQIERVEANIGDTVQLDVTVNGFTEVLGYQYSIAWNPEELDLAGVDNFGIPDLSANNFGINPNLQARGKLSTSWTYLQAVNGVSVPDGSVLFSMSFIVKNLSTGVAYVSFDEDPAPNEIIFTNERVGKIPALIDGAIDLTFANVTYNPLSIASSCVISADCGASGGSININAQGGTSPYSYVWTGPGDFSATTKDLTNLIPGKYDLRVLDTEGESTFASFYVEAGDSGFFAGIGIECIAGVDTALLTAAAFGDSPPYYFQWSNGLVDSAMGGEDIASTIVVPLSGIYSATVTNSVGCSYVTNQVRPAEFCSNQVRPLALNMPDMVINQIGDTIKVPIVVSGFDNLTQLSFSIDWDSTGLELLEVNTNAQLANATINTNATNLGFSWTSASGLTIGDFSNVAELCFIVESMPTMPEIRFSGTPTLITAIAEGQTTVPVTTDNAKMFFSDFDNIQLSVANATVAPGETVCLPVLVSGFTDIVGMQFQLSWDTAAFEFQEVDNFNLPNLTESQFGLDQVYTEGSLKVSWLDQTLAGQSLPSDGKLFDICLQAKSLGASTAVRVDTSGFPIEFINSSLIVLGVEWADGNVSILEEVWPGDANANGLVNHLDLFNIGLGFGEVGPNRPEASLSWFGQFSTPWEKLSPGSNIDYQHADTDGNGIIDASDVDALLQNWTRTRSLPEPPGIIAETRNEGAPLYIELDTLTEGMQVNAPIYFGTLENPAENVYALAFTILYDASVVKPESVDIDFSDSWLSEEEGDLLNVFRAFPSEGKIEVAVSRTDGRSLSGFGLLGHSAITIEDVIFGVRNSKEFQMEITDVRMIDALERPGSTAPQTTTTVIESVTSTLNLLPENSVEVYPSPAHQTSWIKIKQDLKRPILQLLDMSGRLVQQNNTVQSIHPIDVSQLKDGIYIIKIVAEEGVISKRLVVKH